MKISGIKAVYFSAVGNTRKVVEAIAIMLSDELGAAVETVDFTLPDARKSERTFGPEDLVIFGTPTYAGRVPNKVLPFVQTLFHGQNTPAVSVVTFGNRNSDSSLTELTEEMGRYSARAHLPVIMYSPMSSPTAARMPGTWKWSLSLQDGSRSGQSLRPVRMNCRCRWCGTALRWLPITRPSG